MNTPPTCVSIKKCKLIMGLIMYIYIGRSMNKYITGALGSKWQNIYPTQKFEVEECLRLYEERVRNDPICLLT